jgi:Flp pilus assembly protein TadG
MKKPVDGKRFTRDTRGIAILEFALILPVFLLLLCAVIEFGWYFIRYEAVNRAVSITAATIANGGNTLTQANAEANASGVISFNNDTNFICTQAYSTNAAALTALADLPATPTLCDVNTVWPLGSSTTPPTCTDTGKPCVSPYFVEIIAYAQPFSLTGLVGSILPKVTSITQHAIQPVGGASSSGLPTNCSAGQTITWNGSAFVCSPQVACLKNGAVYSGRLNLLSQGNGDDYQFLCINGVLTKVCYSTGGFGAGDTPGSFTTCSDE